jgi:hypothetical protein
MLLRKICLVRESHQAVRKSRQKLLGEVPQNRDSIRPLRSLRSPVQEGSRMNSKSTASTMKNSEQEVAEVAEESKCRCASPASGPSPHRSASPHLLALSESISKAGNDLTAPPADTRIEAVGET